MSAAVQIVLNAVDNATGVIGQVKSQLGDLSTGAGKFNALGKGLQSVGGGMMSAGGAILGLTAPVVGLGAAAVMTASNFETSMAEVSKAANLEGQGLADMRQQILEMSRIPGMPAATSIAEIAAAGGRLGVAASDLDDFTGLISKMSVAFDMTAADAGSSAASIANNFGMMDTATGKLDMGRLETFGNVVNNLADNMATTEGNVVNFANRAAGVGKTFGIMENDVAALGAGFTALGIAPEKAATAFNSTAQKLAMATELSPKAQEGFEQLGISATEMQAAFESGNGTEAYMDFLNTVSDAGPEAGSALSKIFGQGFSDEILQAAGGIEQFEKAFDKATEAVGGGGSTMQQSFDIMANTSAAQFQLLKNSIAEVGISVGSALLPALNGLMSGVAPLAQRFAEFAQANPGVIQMAAGFVAIAAAVGTALVAIGGVVSAIGTLISAASAIGAFVASMGGMGAILGTVGTAVAGIAAVVGGPLLLVGAAIAAVGVAFVAMGGDVSMIVPVLQQAGMALMQFPQNLMQIPAAIGGVFGMIGSYFTIFVSRVVMMGAQIRMAFTSAFQGVGMMIGMVIQSITMRFSMLGAQIGAAMASAGAAVRGAIAGIIAAFSSIGAAIAGVVATIRAGFAQIPAAIQGAIAQAVAVVSGAAGAFQAAGAGLMQALAAGIMAGIGAAVSAVSAGVAQIRALLPGSDAEVGPLSQLTASGAALMPTFAQGIQSTAGAGFGALQSALSPIVPTLTPSIAPAPRVPSPSSGGVGGSAPINITINLSGAGGGDPVENLRAVAGEIAEMIEEAIAQRDRTKYS